MSSSRILLVLGSGKNIGHHVAEVFRKAGYQIAVVSRSVQDGAVPDNGYLSIQRDLSDSASVPCIFETVKAKFGGPPSVIVYNAATVTFAYDETNPFSVPIEGLNLDNAVNNTSAYIAAREAVAGFETMCPETLKAFIYTGNLFAGKALPLPLSESLGISKSAASYWVGSASEFYKDRGYKYVVTLLVHY